MVQFSLWDIFTFLLGAVRWTVALSLIAFIGGGLAGMGLLMLRFSKLRGVATAVAWYVQIFQGTPLLMQLFLVYFGLALLGMDTSPLVAAAICLTLYASAYLTEIWRGCVNAIPKGQWEASTSLALSYAQQMRYVILPQALRVGVAPTVGFLVQIIKGTALASVIGFVELTKAGQMISNATYQPFLAYTFVGLLYFALCYPLSWWSQRLENRRLA
ncbi:amino acid ABC transporter permease [Rhodoferax sp.]|uniref:amino acid ABC transporter permease n=1 Tax=Rhodoferax sp. TaxID=50421 RepID=UPI00263A15BD|nr:amino acid ABC transporter permease [Rhodoferax sp.]MDD2926623.1 amino acid ABC transporter permease [Rhodoferax sp.]